MWQLFCNKLKFLVLLLFLFTISACHNMHIKHSNRVVINPQHKIAIFPFSNTSESPQAGERASAITQNILFAKGAKNISFIQTYQKNHILPGLKNTISLQRMFRIARIKHIDYFITGNVTEWNYRAGLDGDPAIGITMELYYMPSNQMIWAATGSNVGTGKSSLAENGSILISKILKSIKIKTPDIPKKVRITNRQRQVIAHHHNQTSKIKNKNKREEIEHYNKVFSDEFSEMNQLDDMDALEFLEKSTLTESHKFS